MILPMLRIVIVININFTVQDYKNFASIMYSQLHLYNITAYKIRHLQRGVAGSLASHTQPSVYLGLGIDYMQHLFAFK